MTESQFEIQYQPINNHLVPDAPFSGWMYETYGAELEFINTKPVSHIWTVVESDDGHSIVFLPGNHPINRIGFILTEISWTDPHIEISLE